MGLRLVSDHVMAKTDSFQTVAKELPVRSKAVGVGFVVNISGITVKSSSCHSQRFLCAVKFYCEVGHV